MKNAFLSFFLILAGAQMSFGQTTCDPQIISTSVPTPTGVVVTLQPDPPNIYGSAQYTWYVNADTLYGEVVTTILDSSQMTAVCLETLDPFFGCLSFTCDTLFSGSSSSCSVTFDYEWPDSTSISLTAESNVDPTLVVSIDYTWSYLGMSITGNPVDIVPPPTLAPFTMCVTSDAVFLDGSTCSDSFCINVESAPSTGANCSTFFTYSYATASGTTLDFVPDSLSYLSYSWDFGDGNISTDILPNNTYTTNGIYTVCLEVMNTDSCVAIFCEDVIIGNSPADDSCSVWFDYVIINDSVIITPYSDADPILSTVTYYWDLFGIGIPLDGLLIPTSYFDSDPAFCISAIITYADGTSCTAYECEDIIINSLSSCDASFGFSHDPYDSLLVSFFPLDTMNSYVSYAWDFGDGSTSNAAFPVYSYASDDEVIVCLTVEMIDAISGLICSDTYCQPVFEDISGPPNPPGLDSCFAFYFYGVNSDGMTVDFFSSFFGFPAGTAYTWDFGDGSSDTIADPVHTFVNDGVYNVCLTIADSSGCTETYCEWITISGTSVAYNISGQVDLEGDDFAIVYLIAYDPIDSSLTAVGSALADYFSNGDYTFTNVSNGDYLVKAALIPGSEYYWDYLPTYYGDVELWSDATFVTVAGNSFQNVAIDLIAGTNSGGPGFISGLIADGAGKLQTEGLAEIEVLLYNELSQPIGYTYSDEDGNYTFDNLAYGTYWITADHYGYDFNMRQVILNEDQETVINADVQLGAEDVISSIGITAEEIANISVYPTLVHSDLHISNESYESYFYTIIDINGQSLIQGSVSPGLKTLDLKSIESGSYILAVYGDDTIDFFRFIKE